MRRRTGGDLCGPGPGGGDDEVVADDGEGRGLLEDDAGALVGVVGVDRDVGRAGQQDPEDRDVQVGGAGADPHPDLRAGPGADRGEPAGDLGGRLLERRVGEDLGARVDGGRVAVRLHDVAEDLDERAGRRGAVPGEERREEGGVSVCHALIVP